MLDPSLRVEELPAPGYQEDTRQGSGVTEEIKTLKTGAEREAASWLKFLNPQNNRSLFLKRCTFKLFRSSNENLRVSC